MGHKTNPIGFRLAQTVVWRDTFVSSINKYNKNLHQVGILKEICKNYFTNYSVPQFVPGTLRNDKKLEQKNRNIQKNIITNTFITSNIVYADTTIRRTRELNIQNALLDGGQLDKKITERKNFKKTDSAYVKPKLWKRNLAKSLLDYKNALKKTRRGQIEADKPEKTRKMSITVKSFKLAFKIKIKEQQLNKNENKENRFKMKLKIFVKPKQYRLKNPENEIDPYYLVLNKPMEATDNDLITPSTNTKSKITLYLNIANKNVNELNSYTENKILNKTQVVLNFILSPQHFFLFLYQTIKNRRRRDFRKHSRVKRKNIRHNRLRRYPLILQHIFAKQKHELSIICGVNKFKLLKCLIKGFNTILAMSYKRRVYFLLMFKKLLTSFFSLIGNIPQMFILCILANLILAESAEKHKEIQERRNFFSYRYLIYQITNAALISAISTIEKKGFVALSFLGKHTRNMSANLLKNYMLQKLSQYFTVQEILKPIIFDLRTSPLVYGFRIIVAGRITRKERAAFLIKNFNNLPLNKKVAKIDYAAGFRIQKFGVVGIKIFLYIKNIRTSYYNYSFVTDTQNNG